jgi:hypothetical protein
MASTYVNDLRLNEMATGDASGSWGTVTNTNLELIGEAFSYGTETIGDADSTLTIADGAADAARSFYLKITSSVDLTTTRIVTLGPNTVSKVWMIENATTGSQVITIKQGSGATINVPNGQVKMISTDGAGSGGAVLDLLVDVDLTGTTTLVNLDVSGTLGVTGVLTATSLDISGDIDVDGTTNLDVVDIDGAVDMASTLLVTGVLTTTAATVSNGGGQFNGAINVGVDDTGYDVKFFGATAGAYMLWDESADDLILGGAAGLSVNSAALVTGVLTTTAATVSNGGGQFNGAINVGVDDTGYDVKFFGATTGKSLLWDESADSLIVTGTTTLVGTTNLDAVDIDGATQIDATVTVGVDDTGYDVKFFGATAGAYMLWDESADDLILGGAAGLSVNSTALVTGVLTTTAATVSNGGGQFNGAINVGVDDTGYDVKFFGATAGKYMLWDESADTLEVSGTVVAAAGTALLPSITTTGDLNTGMWFPAADTIAVSTAGVERMRIDSEGRLGLGITPSATTAFTVFQNKYLSLYGFDQAQSHILTNTYYPVDNGDYKRQATGYALKLSMNSGKYIFNIGASGAADSVIAFTQAMTLDENGNLLVGLTTAEARFTIGGAAATAANSIICRIGNDAYGSDIVLSVAPGVVNFDAPGVVGGRMMIDSSGNFAIPSSYDHTTASGANVFFRSDGYLQRSTSSLKYKNTVEDAPHGLTELLTLRPVTYKGNNDGDTVFGGLIAEEVHDSGLTEFVQYNDDGEPDALAYGNMVSLCIKAIQEQQAIITALETRLSALEG